MASLKKAVEQLGKQYELTPARWATAGGLALCAASLSWGLGLGGSAGALVLFVLLFWLARREWSAPSPGHARVWGGVYGLLLSAVLTVSRLVRGGTEIFAGPLTNYIEWNGLKDLSILLPLAVLLWLAFLQLRRVCAAHSLNGMEPRPRGRRCFFIAWGLIFLCWSPYLLAYWPAGLVGDGSHALESALAGGVPSGNHWVVLYILTLRFFVRLAGLFGGSVSVGLCLYAVAQSAAFAAACAAVVWQLYRLGIPRLAVAACTVMYACSGFFASYGMAAWKDTLFSAAVVLLAMQVWQAGVRGESPRQAAAFFFTLLFVCFWRNNGIYVAVPTVVILAVVCRRQALRMAAAGAAALVITLAVQGPGYDALGIAKDSLTESISVPLQQLAATLCEGRPITEEQSEVLFSILPEEEWTQAYSPCISDGLKSNARLDGAYLEEHFSDFLRVWAELLPANLDVYVEAYLMQTLGFWQPGSWNGYYYEYFVGVQDLYGRGIVSVDWFREWTGLDVAGILQNHTRFVSCGTMVWVMLGVFFFCLAKPRGRRRADLLLLTPLLFSWLSLMLAVPIAHSYRYALMLPVALPLLCLLPLYDRCAAHEST